MTTPESIETDNIDSSTKKAESIVAKTSKKLSDHEIDNSSNNNSVTSQEVAGQIKAVIDHLSRQLEQLCDLMPELKEEQSGRRHEETTFFRATSSSSGSGIRSDT